MKPLLLPICFLFSTLTAYCPTALKILPNRLNGAICPKTNKYHSVVAERGPRPDCTYTWSVTEGSIDGAVTGVGFYVKWNDLATSSALSLAF
jgi:hypothetical protein